MYLFSQLRKWVKKACFVKQEVSISPLQGEKGEYFFLFRTFCGLTDFLYVFMSFDPTTVWYQFVCIETGIDKNQALGDSEYLAF